MDTLRAMQVFVEVARQNGFAPAAKELGLSTSSVSRHITNLEDLLGAELFARTTRHLRLTQAGDELFGRCERVVGEVDELVQGARRASPSEPGGRLRVTMPSFMGAMLMEDVVSKFVLEHPRVDLELALMDRTANLVEEGFDLAIRTGVLTDSTLISRKFLDMKLALVASPDYLEKHGPPLEPADLREHNCIIDTNAPYGDKWPLRVDDATRRIQVRSNMRVNSGSGARDLAVGGVGLTLLPDYIVYADVDAGRLITVLDEHVVNEGGIYIVYPHSRHISRAVRTFTDLLIEHARPISKYRSIREAGS